MKHTLDTWVHKASLEKHCLITGATGSGKSQLLLGMAHSLIYHSKKRRDCSVVVLEPHADLATRLMASRALEDDRLVYISSTIQRESGWHESITPVFNPFQLPEDADETFKSLLATQLTSAIIEMVETSQFGITLNMEMILRPVILVTLSSPNPSLDTVKRFLTSDNKDLLKLGLSYPHPQIQSFFRDSFNNKHYEITKAGLVSKLNWFLNDIGAYNMLTGNGIDIEQCLDSGKVIIVNTPRGANPFIASLVGRLIVAYIFAIVLRRESKPMQDRLPIYMFVDEVAHYATSSLMQSLHEARKYKLSLTMALQSQKSLPVHIRNAIATNTFLQCLSISDADAKKQFKAQTGVSYEELEKLEPMVFLVAKNDGMKSKPFRTRVKILGDQMFLDKKGIKERLCYLIQYSGVYQPVPPPPTTPSLPVSTTKDNNKEQGKKQANDDPFAGHDRAFLTDKTQEHGNHQ